MEEAEFTGALGDIYVISKKEVWVFETWVNLIFPFWLSKDG